jgi:LysM repeat protein
MLLFSLIAVAFSSVFVPTLATPCTRTYTVRDGDICDSISAANNVSTYQLAVLNPAINSDCTNLLPGQTLCLGASGKDCTTTYVVRPNDDCNVVSSAYNINATVLSYNNPQLNADCSNLYIGEVLCVAGTDTVPPAPPGNKTPGTKIPTTATPARPQHTLKPDDGDDDDLPWCD